MRHSIARGLPLALASLVAIAPLAAQSLTPQQQFAKEVYRELLEINTSNMTSGTTPAANAMAKRFRDAGFLEIGRAHV